MLLSGLIISVCSCTFFRAPGKDDCDKILTREQMVEVMTDIYLLESYLSEYRHIDSRITDSAGLYYSGVFKHHNIDPAEFEEALNCYLLDRREMDLIHELMLNRLSIMQSETGQDQVPGDEPPPTGR